jgi:hypothetical protein
VTGGQRDVRERARYSALVGQSMSRHSTHGRPRPLAPITLISGHPHSAQVLPVGMIVPRCGSGNVCPQPRRPVGAGRIALLADAGGEALAGLAAQHAQLPPAVLAHAQREVFAHAAADALAHLLDVAVEQAPGLLEHALAVGHDLAAPQLALADAVHLVLEPGGHLAGRDVERRLLHGHVEGGDQRDAELGRLDRVVAHVVAVVQVLDDVGPRRLGAESEVLHLLDELPWP